MERKIETRSSVNLKRYNERKVLLLDYLKTHSYEYSDVPKFQLVSGIMSNEYFDCKKTLCLPEVLPVVGEVVSGLVLPYVTAIGGLTMGADPIAICTSYYTAGDKELDYPWSPLRWFSIRKQAKHHGTNKFIVGNLKEQESVVIVDDVVTSGGSTIEAIEKAQEANVKVAQVIVLVDREQGGMQKIRDFAGPSVPVVAVFTKTEIKGYKSK